MLSLFAEYAEHTHMQRYEILHRTYYNFSDGRAARPPQLAAAPEGGP